MKIMLTGINRGIGQAMCELALSQGHEVIGISRSPLPANHELASKHPGFTHFVADVTKAADLKNLEKKLAETTTHLDVLINNAGVLHDAELSFDQTTEDIFLKTFQVNLFGVHAVTQIAKNLLIKAKNPKVFSISSVMGSIDENASGRYYAYRSSKAALNAWNKSFSLDHPKIASIVIHPGWVSTEMGGAQAPVTPKVSAAGILELVQKRGLESTGKFFDYTGREIPW